MTGPLDLPEGQKQEVWAGEVSQAGLPFGSQRSAQDPCVPGTLPEQVLQLAWHGSQLAAAPWWKRPRGQERRHRPSPRRKSRPAEQLRQPSEPPPAQSPQLGSHLSHVPELALP